jgi:periodic tryptophan protein 1
MSSVGTWILSTLWIQKGKLQKIPQDYQMATEELEELNAGMKNLSTSTQTQKDSKKDSKKENDKKTPPQQKKTNEEKNDDGLGGESEGSDLDDDGVDRFDNMDEFMADYTDDDEDDDEDDAISKFLTQSTTIDPDVIEDEFLADDDEDDEDNQINPNASIFLTGQTDPRQDECFIEVQVYDNETNGLYTHHDIQIPAPPITMAYLSMFNPQLDPQIVPGQQGAFVAVGMMAPSIQIWNLDVMHPIEPTLVLGGYDFAQDVAQPKSKGAKSKKIAPKLKQGSHSDNVTSLSWSPTAPDALLSASGDKTIKLWQISTATCMHTWNHHSETVAVVQLNPLQPQVFLSGSESGHVTVIDLNTKNTVFEYKPAPVSKKGVTKPMMKKPTSVTLETARWNNINPNLFYVALSNGIVQCFDIRHNGKVLWEIEASSTKKPVPSIAPSTFSETLFATVGEDGIVKVWDLPVNHPTAPQVNDGIIKPMLLTSRHVDVGRLFSCSFDVNNPFVLGTGGDAGCPAIWDLMENVHVNKRYKDIVQNAGFGDQTLPADYIKQQLMGIQSKGIGPGKQSNENDAEDYDEDDEFEDDGLPAMHFKDGDDDDGDGDMDGDMSE